MADVPDATGRPLRGALIGCGFFARNHLYAWRQLDGVDLAALCDTDPGRLRQAASEFGVARTYTDAAALFASEKLDFVDIATTVNSHRALVEMAAKAGVHAICQKPFADTMDHARAMVAACDAAGVALMVHENFRWQAPLLAVRAALAAGAIGTPFWARISFRSAFDVFSGQPYLATTSRFIIQDLGIHIIDIARCLLGEVATVSATTQRINPRIQGEDVATLLLRHRSGATSVVDCSYATRLEEEIFPQTLVEVDGDGGSVRLNAGYELVVTNHDGGTTRTRCEPQLHPWASRPWHNIQDSVVNIQRHWLECLRQQKEPETSGRDNLGTLELVEGAYASAAQAMRAITLDR
jgi:predicted dehydrogenase